MTSPHRLAERLYPKVPGSLFSLVHGIVRALKQPRKALVKDLTMNRICIVTREQLAAIERAKHEKVQ